MNVVNLMNVVNVANGGHGFKKCRKGAENGGKRGHENKELK